MVDRTVDLGAEIVVVLEKLELTRGVSAEGSCGWVWGGLEGFDLLVRVPIDHAIYKGVFAVLEFDIFGGLHFAVGESDVEGDIVSAFI